MPLISEPEHGTVFGLTGQRGPTAQELKALQDACEGDDEHDAPLPPVPRRCGGPAGRRPQRRVHASTRSRRWRSSTTSTARKAYQAKVEAERDAQRRGQERRAGRRSADETQRRSRCWSRSPPRAAAGSTSISATPHEFQIYEVSTRGRQIRRPPPRRPVLPGRLWRGRRAANRSSARINDCHAVLVAKIGGCPKDELTAAGIEPVDDLRPRVHREVGDRLVQGLSANGSASRRDRARRARRCGDPPGRVITEA